MGLICALLSALGTISPSCSSTAGAVAAPDVDMRHPLRSRQVDLERGWPDRLRSFRDTLRRPSLSDDWILKAIGSIDPEAERALHDWPT